MHVLVSRVAWKSLYTSFGTMEYLVLPTNTLVPYQLGKSESVRA